jgi:hypothetical protein
MQKCHRFSAFMLILVAAPAMLIGQGTSTSALTGLVRGPSGQAFKGARVRIASPSMIGGEKATVSAENGSYRFSALPPGRYRITVDAPGMATLTGSETLELGRTATLNWKLRQEGSALVEVVASASADLDSSPVGLTANYNTADLATLPTERSLSGIMNLTPGVNANHAWGGDTRENAWMMDGINISDPQSNTQWIFPNPDWFSEIQVGGVGSPAEFGGFTGGFVNGIIKRGGNTTTGNFSSYYGDSKWQANSTNNDTRLSAADKLQPPAKDWDMAINIGGPIIKDKLWYFASYERKQGQTTPVGAPVPVDRKDTLALVKLTWQATPSATLEGIYEYDLLTREHRNIDLYTEVAASLQQNAPNHSYGLTWTQTLGSDKVLTLKGFGYSGTNEQKGYHGEDYGLDSWDYYQGKEYFHNPTMVSYDLRARFTLSATFDWFKAGLFSAGDNHAFRMGIEHESIKDEEVQRTPGNIGLVGFGDTDANGNDIIMTDYFYTGGGWNIKERATRLTFFAQDAWTVNDRLTLRPGLRFEQQKANAVGHPTAWNTFTVAPRFGATIALSADQKNLLKFHWGRFYSAFSASYIDRMYQSMLPPEVRYAWGTPASGYSPVQIDPFNYATWPKPVLNDPNNPAYQTVSGYAPTDPNARQPYMDETSLAFEHRFQGPWTFSATYLYRVNKDNLLKKDLAKDNGAWESMGFWDYRNDPEGNNKTYINVWQTSIASDQHNYLVTNIPEAKRAFWSGTVSMNRAFQDNWSMSASYTRARRYGNSYKANGYDELFESPNNQINANGLLPGFDDNEFKLHGLYELPWKMRISGSFTYLSGNHFTPYARFTDDQGIRMYPNIETRGSQKYDSSHLVNLRLTQVVPLAKGSDIELFAEVFNLLNTGTASAWGERMNTSTYKLPSTIEQARRLRLGLRVNF